MLLGLSDQGSYPDMLSNVTRCPICPLNRADGVFSLVYYRGKTKGQMPNTHLEHPEELILTGETWVLDALANPQNVSLKIDGAPAIVWGFHPHNGQFFVGTKSVFNKIKIKIAYTHEDVLTHYGHSSNLCRILCACLDSLPRVPGIFQGDFIGFGGSDTYTPNTLTYVFPEVITKDVIIAPHTSYIIPGRMCDAMAQPLTELMPECDGVHWVEPVLDFAPNPSKHTIKAENYEGLRWLTQAECERVKRETNRKIREGHADTWFLDGGYAGLIGDEALASLAIAVAIKKRALLKRTIVSNCPKTYLNGREIPTGEGLVLHHPKGALKVVKRQQFSAANFLQGRFQS